MRLRPPFGKSPLCVLIYNRKCAIRYRFMLGRRRNRNFAHFYRSPAVSGRERDARILKSVTVTDKDLR